MFVLTENGLELVQEAEESFTTHPIRIVTQVKVSGSEWESPREDAYQSAADAVTQLDYLGESVEDIRLVMCRGVTPSELGFSDAVAY